MSRALLLLFPSDDERVAFDRGFQRVARFPPEVFDAGCADLMEGWRVHYNLVRTHQALGITPGEAAGLPTIGGFRWLELLKTAAKNP